MVVDEEPYAAMTPDKASRLITKLSADEPDHDGNKPESSSADPKA
jgi:hypothetical protein